MSKVIVCDKCKCEDCSVSEIVPASKKISMKNLAAKGKSPYGIEDAYQAEQYGRKWKITCPECNHSLTYSEHMSRPIPMFNAAGG